MPIKSYNTDFNLIPSPPTGYTYIGTDTSNNLLLKLDTGVVIHPLGANYLDELLDVAITSGLTTGQFLQWDGNDWVNADGSGPALSAEISERVSGDQSLSGAYKFRYKFSCIFVFGDLGS
jgi:hypothetical protein